MTYPSPANRPLSANEIIKLIEQRIQELYQAAGRESGGWYQELFGHKIEELEELLMTIHAGKYPKS